MEFLIGNKKDEGEKGDKGDKGDNGDKEEYFSPVPCSPFPVPFSPIKLPNNALKNVLVFPIQNQK
ncbi:MAG: hypothetical protein C6Y22_11890 [Hapalosiphonaceae cyanobacterium JJU2]|nr:MAG: hypothetical protein C6Y22_11890 [Hapalosiphonaceae cyanobacterium JJU2]